MAVVANATAFVTEASGFIGIELIKELKARGHEALGLTWSFDEARRVRNAGATAIVGNPLEPGQWQDEAAAADWVFHLLPKANKGSRLRWIHATSISRARLSADAHLLDAVAAGAAKRIVYVSDASYYGPAGPRPITEDDPPRPSPWERRCLSPAFKRLDGYIAAGLPVVMALPGWVYGNGGWCRERVVEPVMAGRRVVQFGKTGQWVSAIHVHDCARALVHLAERGEVGSRYFLVNTDPIRVDEFGKTFARLANRPLRMWRVPLRASALIASPASLDVPKADAVFSNIRLRGLGFQFRYPTVEDGFEQILGALHERSAQ
jgi:nucleoside-diphosphate-sugar epimerase